MPAAYRSGRRLRAPRVLAVLGLALVFAALGSGGSASADSGNPATTTVLTVSPTLAVVGQPVTLTATVTGVGGNPPGSIVFGTPAQPAMQTKRQIIALRKLPDLLRKLGK